MEYEGYLNAQLLLAVLEVEEGDEVIDDRFRGIFRTNEVESYPKDNVWAPCKGAMVKMWYEPAIKSGNSFLRARQSSVYHWSSSGVTILTVQ